MGAATLGPRRWFQADSGTTPRTVRFEDRSRRTAQRLYGFVGEGREAQQGSFAIENGRQMLGKLCLRTNDPKAAEDQFEAALLVQPNNVDAQLGLAQSMVAQKQFADAAHVLESIKPANNPEVLDLLAETYSHLGKTAQARQARLRAQSLKTKSS